MTESLILQKFNWNNARNIIILETSRKNGGLAFSHRDSSLTTECFWPLLRLQPPLLSGDLQIACPTRSHGATHSLVTLLMIRHISAISNAAAEAPVGSLCTTVCQVSLLILSQLPTQLSQATDTTLVSKLAPSWVFQLQAILRALGIQLLARQLGFSRNREILLQPQQQLVQEM